MGEEERQEERYRGEGTQRGGRQIRQKDRQEKRFIEVERANRERKKGR